MVKASLDPSGGYAIRGEILQRFLFEPAGRADFLHGVPGEWRAQVEGFLTQYLGTPAYPAPFGGREKKLQELDVWLTTPESPRYALIAAPGGMGKSALLAHWVDALQKRDAPFLLVYHPISARWQTNSASVVFQCLAFRLAAVFADPAPDSQDVDQLRKVILGYIEKANRENRPLVIVLDGLDEAAGWQADTRLFPPTRQGCVRILASARPLSGEGPREWLVRLGWSPFGLAKRLDLDLLDKEGVAAVLQGMGDPLAPLAHSFDIVGTLYRQSGGDPLLVGLHVEELREYVTRPRSFQSSERDRIEPGLAGFFNFWLENQAKLWGDDRHNREPRVRTMLGLCSLAYGPLTREEFRALAPKAFARNADVEVTARDLSLFLTSEAGAHTYVFAHPRFGEFVREEILKPEERADLTARFVAYGSRVLAELNEGEREHAPTYVVRWYATHLADLGRPLEAFRPLLNLRWYQECERLDGTPAGFLAQLDQAWNTASGQAGVGTRVRIALLRSSLLTLGRIIPAEVFERCAQAGILSPMLAEVIARQHNDAKTRSQYFLVLAALVPDGRNRLLQEALDLARQIQDESARAQALSAVAARLPDSDRQKVLREALEAARQIQNGDSRAYALSAVAAQLPDSDRQKVLREALEAAIDPYYRVQGLSAVAERLPDSDRQKVLREALDLARQIQNEYSRAYALSAVAARLPDSDRELLREVLEAVRQIQNESARAQALSAVAARLPDSDRELLREALEAARQFQRESARAQALSAVAARLDTAVLHQLAEDFQSLIQQNEAVRFLNLIASRWPIYVKASKKASADELAYWLEPLSREPRYHLLRAISALLPAIEHTGGEQAVIETAEAIIDTARWWR